MRLLLLLYLLVSLSVYVLPPRLKRYKALIPALWQFLVFFYFLGRMSYIQWGGSVQISMNWLPQLGINFDLVLDGLSWMFALIISGIGGLVFLYAHAYMKKYPYTDSFFFQLMLFSGAMLGLVLSQNLIMLFVFWELTSLLSFLLISFFHEKKASREAAFQSFFITGFGGLSLLAGIILLGGIVDSYNVFDWVENAKLIQADSRYTAGLILVLGGVFTKSAQFPFHFWLPGAMQAPTPVSAYLHSATMVKAGIFLLARLNPALGGTPEWSYIISGVGALTMLVGAYMAITQTDLKAVLAYTTISALGTLVLLMGIDTKVSIKAALVFMFVHAFYKATLFMVAGIIDKKTGTRDIAKLSGLARAMPITFVMASLALLSMAGLPPMLGFIGKELIYEAKVQSPGIANLLIVFGVSANIFMVAVSVFLIFKIFAGRLSDKIKRPNEKGFLFMFGPVVLIALSLLYGLFPHLLNPVVQPALEVIRTASAEVELKMWHGFNDVFLLSVFTIVTGLALAFFVLLNEKFLRTWRRISKRIFTLDFSALYLLGVDRFVALSRRNTAMIQHGYHRFYLLTIFVFTAGLLWFLVYDSGGLNLSIAFSPKPFYISGLVLVVILSAMYSMVAPSRIITIIAMGVVGYGISLIYLFYSAIDLAITQILVETLTVVMFMLILQRLPRFAHLSSKRSKWRDLFIALAFGSVMTLVALSAINVDAYHPIADFFLDNSLSEAYGENVVNVILVDFRALDTMGEITVLTIAALGVYMLLRNHIKDS
ncbi:MAG: hydrogen gas-evolving membrane-bound hydrogenase subunit E [Bacteroidales bacterium]|jgi:multicomponent Na+:H+ antiporter subunit A